MGCMNLLVNCSGVTSPVWVSWDKTLKNPGTQKQNRLVKKFHFCSVSSITKWWPDSYSLKNTGLEHVVQSVSDSPLLKSAIQRGLTTRPSPGLDGLIGGEKDTVLLLQSNSWSREGSKSGVSSSNIPQSLLRKHTHTEIKSKDAYTHTHKCGYARY